MAHSPVGTMHSIARRSESASEGYQRSEPVGQRADYVGRDDEIADVGEEQDHGAEHRPHAAGRQIVEQAEARADVEVDRRDEDPQRHARHREIARVVDDSRGDGRDADAGGEQPDDAARVGHGAARHEPAGGHGGETPAPQVHVLGDVAACPTLR